MFPSFSNLGIPQSFLSHEREEDIFEDATPYISWTQAAMVLRCPMQYKYRYVDGWKSPPNAYMVQGGALHKTQELHYRSRIAGNLGFRNQSQACEAFEFVLSSKKEEEEVDWSKISYEEAIDQGAELLRAYFRDLEPHIRPQEVEMEFTVSLGESFPFNMHGYIDLLDTSDGVLIRDTKYKGRKPSQAAVDKDLQLTLYAAAYRILTGRREAGLVLDVVSRTKKPSGEPFRTTRTDSQIDGFFRVLEGAARAILEVKRAPDMALRNPSQDFVTGLRACDGCGYHDDCMGVLGF